jgi:transketolase
MSAQSEADALSIRRHIIRMLEQAKSGHAGGALGLADVVAVLYREVINHRPTEPRWPGRDRLVLSNGHVCPVLYSALALHGYFPEKDLLSLRQIHSALEGHPKANLDMGIEVSSGPLGQGISQAVGMALAGRYQGRSHHIYAITSDGEHQEGQTWEAYLAGSKYKLDNLTVIVDRNFIQISGVTEQIMPLESLPEKLKAFGWRVYEVDGHDHGELKSVLLAARDDSQPSVVVAYTEPGRGVDFMEGKYSWHGSPPSPEEASRALRQLNSLSGSLETDYD